MAPTWPELEDAGFMRLAQARQQIFIRNNQLEIVDLNYADDCLTAYSKIWPEKYLRAQFTPEQSFGELETIRNRGLGGGWYRMESPDRMRVYCIYMPLVQEARLDISCNPPVIRLQCSSGYALDMKNFPSGSVLEVFARFKEALTVHAKAWQQQHPQNLFAFTVAPAVFPRVEQFLDLFKPLVATTWIDAYPILRSYLISSGAERAVREGWYRACTQWGINDDFLREGDITEQCHNIPHRSHVLIHWLMDERRPPEGVDLSAILRDLNMCSTARCGSTLAAPKPSCNSITMHVIPPAPAQPASMPMELAPNASASPRQE